ncbi:disease resistance protein Roq1 [Ziziphus jujuba]|uniref:Disease resistance protein Roq1 n=1 Tax=Ziziphus jujuba TaxID=326968 RepID=A0A6P4AHA9_ZIZJJ|nr:disease resistance protein Roq1 [Ziziphus jujuba]
METEKSLTCSSSSSSRKYDVFLSLRGEDIGKSFADHLYKALSDKGIYTLGDNNKLKTGNDVSPELLKAIEESRFAIIVFSEGYAASTRCLIELAKIFECKKKNLGFIVLPVFYHVEPTHVRKQTGEFGKAFAMHEAVSQDDIEKVNKWRKALKEIASVSGWHIKERHETEDIGEIVKVVLKDLNMTFSVSNNDLVGMTSRIEKIYSLLKLSQLEDVHTVGICGMKGIGKTTIAEEVFKMIYRKFEAFAFIANIREEFEKNDIVHLQKRLYKFLLDEEPNIQNAVMGRDELRKRLCSRRVLIILDDVDDLEQIEHLVGSAEEQHDWLHLGSRVIVTTTDKDLLKTYGENNIYEVDKLDDEEALQLFSRKAFKQDHPFDNFVNLSKDVVEYANGNPRALKVLSSFLVGRNMDEWSDMIDKLKKNPDKDILRIFK